MSIIPFFRFLGGLPFALILIAAAAAFAIAGTFLESMTDSHQYAAYFTYDSPLFSLLLWGFFLNILISALRRYPFQKMHIPFLMTHLGMLMLLTGVFIKTHFGVQGSMMLLEGGGTDQIYLADSYALYVERRTDSSSFSGKFYTLKKNFPRYSRLSPIDNNNDDDDDDDAAALSITLLDYAGHSEEKLERWVKGATLSVCGIKPLPVFHLPSAQHPLPPFISTWLPQSSEASWNILAVKSDEIQSIAEKAYMHSVKVIVRDSSSEKEVLKFPLEKLLARSVRTPYGALKTHFKLNWSPEAGFETPALFFELPKYGESGKMTLPLDGTKALINLYAVPFLGKNKITVDLSCVPTLLFIEDSSGDTFLFAFTKYGQLLTVPLPQKNLQGILAYEDGFLGYSQEIKIPSAEQSLNRHEREKYTTALLQDELRAASCAPEKLALPLQLLHRACQATSSDFAGVTAAYLDEWNKGGGWLWRGESPAGELGEALAAIDWKQVTEGIFQGCYWNARLFEHLDPLLVGKEQDLIAILTRLEWPPLLQMNLQSCPLEAWPFLLQSITLNLFSTAEFFPATPPDDAISSARLLSAYFRAYGLHLGQIQSSTAGANFPSAALTLETPLAAAHAPAPPAKKLEENIPCVVVRFKKGDKEEVISLRYDKLGVGFKWPIFGGEYVVRFQSLFREVPYRLRLREARQVNYPGSAQPFSYESDLVMTHKLTQEKSEHTISMNNVLETWDGYRFYLANITPPDKGSMKQVQIVVNRDPAKYFATYPGAFVMTSGILLLFYRRKTHF